MIKTADVFIWLMFKTNKLVIFLFFFNHLMPSSFLPFTGSARGFSYC